MSETILKHSRMPKRMSVERRAKRAPSLRLAPAGKPIAPELKQAILEDAKQSILQGHTIDQIAAKHGISHYTLDLWLHGLGDEYTELRQAWVDGMLHESGQLLREAQDALGLARARELQRRAQWYAERRDRPRYGQETMQVHVSFTDLGDRLRRARERVIDATIAPHNEPSKLTCTEGS